MRITASTSSTPTSIRVWVSVHPFVTANVSGKGDGGVVVVVDVGQ
jgi:hypothetical protein